MGGEAIEVKGEGEGGRAGVVQYAVLQIPSAAQPTKQIYYSALTLP